MKKKFVFILISIMMLSGCGAIKKFKDLTDTANNLLQTINSIAQQIDTKVETGELSKEVGFLIDERLRNLEQVISNLIQENGGFIFDEVNGTIDNAFQNVSMVLDQIKKGILDDSLPMLISQLSSELQVNINLISSSVEDIVVLTFGNIFVLVDKTVNSVVIIGSVVCLAVGLIIFIVTLFRKDRKLTLFRGIALGFMAIYLVFFCLLLFSNQVRGNIIAGLNFGKKYEGTMVEPKITTVSPSTFTFGKNDKIFIYGRHLNLIDTLGIVLKINNQIRYTFPAKNIIVKSQNRIVLGNFTSWTTPLFSEFKQFMGPANFRLITSKAYSDFAYGVSQAVNPKITASRVELDDIVRPTVVVNRNLANIDRNNLNLDASKINNMKKDIAVQKLGRAQANLLVSKLDQFYFNRFQLPEGDYGIAVLNNDTLVESSQLITIVYPEPPAPLPDIFPTAIFWSGVTPVTGQNTTVSVKLGFLHPEEITRSFKINISTNPPAVNKTITVPMGAISAAQSSNLAIVNTNSFSIQNPGIYTFKATVDEDNLIKEKIENNNELNRNLIVKQYVYDVTVKYTSFESKSNQDSWPGSEDEYRLKFRTTATGHSNWSFNYSKNGEPGHLYSINKSKTFTDLLPGHIYSFYVTCREQDGGAKGGDDYMGEVHQVHDLSQDINNMNQDVVEFPLVLNPAGHKYKITGTYTIKRRIQ